MEPVFEIRLFNLRTGRTMTAQEYAEQLGLAEPLCSAAPCLTAYLRKRTLERRLVEQRADRANAVLNAPPWTSISDVRQEIHMEPNAQPGHPLLPGPATVSMAQTQNIIRSATSMRSPSIAFRGDRRIETGCFRNTKRLHRGNSDRKASTYELQASGFADDPRVLYRSTQLSESKSTRGCHCRACLAFKRIDTEYLIERKRPPGGRSRRVREHSKTDSTSGTLRRHSNRICEGFRRVRVFTRLVDYRL